MLSFLADNMLINLIIFLKYWSEQHVIHPHQHFLFFSYLFFYKFAFF
jgi:hypothetical protein